MNDTHATRLAFHVFCILTLLLKEVAVVQWSAAAPAAGFESHRRLSGLYSIAHHRKAIVNQRTVFLPSETCLLSRSETVDRTYLWVTLCTHTIDVCREMAYNRIEYGTQRRYYVCEVPDVSHILPCGIFSGLIYSPVVP